ncbi:hypothetical protein AEAC466_02540 [Asticcacaulis sp. AC466]|uniref:cytochrome c-type biogenesis protein n=1 Tax=Asticcacaulis sp. AC466 TaxID=1282362 RepID=UPI0003C3F4F2|nr:cytochrome c-type biogenesis protein [Asticcacaulis sp. AC466]ESQ86086.1 hypothetical protein AEAC466_02540 [Asticcacaulis sp. AC466]
MTRAANRYGRFGATCLLIAGLSMGAAFAAPVAEPDPAREARAHRLFTEVRCVQCQSESIADSDADIAGDMRREIRADIAAGKTDAQIRQELFDHYGDYVLFRPRLSLGNVALWLIPPLIVLIGAIFLVFSNKNRSKSKDYDLTDEEEKKLKALLKKRD